MPQTLQEKVLSYIECTGTALAKAEKVAQEKNAQDEQLSKLIPDTVEKLLRNGRIEPHQKQAAADLLRDPVKALEILGRTAEHRNDEETMRLGTQVNTKAASAHVPGSINSPYVGARTSQDKDSDRILFERLGLQYSGNS